MAKLMNVVNHDGGRRQAGFKKAGVRDCVVRSICLATGSDYRKVYDEVWAVKRSTDRKTSPSQGVDTKRRAFREYMEEKGWAWVKCSGLFLRSGQLPKGRLIVGIASHYTCVIDGVIYDTTDCQKAGRRPIDGYWVQN